MLKLALLFLIELKSYTDTTNCCHKNLSILHTENAKPDSHYQFGWEDKHQASWLNRSAPVKLGVNLTYMNCIESIKFINPVRISMASMMPTMISRVLRFLWEMASCFSSWFAFSIILWIVTYISNGLDKA